MGKPKGRAAAPPAAKKRGRPARSRDLTEARRRAILAAALAVFAEHGFEAARLDDVARRASVAKGTLYLYFPDKESMLLTLVREAAAPIVDAVAALPKQADLSFSARLAQLFMLFRREVLGTDRKLILRLLIAEGPRFPEIASFYHREVLSHLLAALRTMAEAAHRNGEIRSDAAARFPQLIAAPLLLSVIWDGMFQRLEPLDVDAMLSAHAGLLAGVDGRRR